MKRIAPVVFIALLAVLALYYNYDEILHKRPQSIHRWRQTDCASIALNYYQHGMHFFRPEVLFQISDGGTSGYTVGECPLLYYFIAGLWKVFGYSDFIYRFVNALIFFLGLFSLFRLLQHYLSDMFWSVSLALLFFTSPVVVYYAPSYLTDTTGLALVLTGLWCMVRYRDSGRPYYFYLALVMFTTGGLIKVASLLAVIALLCVWAWQKIRKKQAEKGFPAFNLKQIGMFVLMFAIIFAWYAFAVHYNKLHKAYAYDGSPYFSTQTFPIWELRGEAILDILNTLWTGGLAEHFHFSVFLLFLLATVLLFIFFKKQDKFLRGMTVFLLIGVILFSLLWFYAFGNHDYYIINLLVLPMFLLLCFFEYLRREQAMLFRSPWFKTAFALLLAFNIHYAKVRAEERYTSWMNDYPVYKDVHTITPYLREIGLSPEDKVICLPDPTTNYTLYLMNQPGWTGTNFFDDSLQVKKYISLGAKYLILTEPEPFSRPCLQPFMKDRIGQYGNVSIFKLQ